MRRFAILSICGLTAGAAPSHAADSLSLRFERLSCAVVQVVSGHETGTAFFADQNGTLISAAHVLYNLSVDKLPSGFRIHAKPKPNIVINVVGRGPFPITVPELTSEMDAQEADDISRVRTDLKTPCFIPLAHIGNHKVGDHVIAIGFPNLSQSQVLYDGFLSSMLMDIPHVIGPITGTPQFLNKADKMLRFQMPIPPGASGSPLIDDNNAAIGVVAEMPVSRLGDLDQLITAELAKPPADAIAPNIPRLLAELAQIVYQEETPGTGLGVPTEYLLQRDASPKAAPSGSPH